jgi:hypothetical protein
VPALTKGFGRVIQEQKGARDASFDTSGEPVLLSARIAAPQGGTIRLGMRLSEEGDPAAEVTIDAETGTVRLDYTRGPLKPLSRPPVLQGMIPPSAMIDMDIMIDGAAVFGAINGRPLGLLAFGGSGARGTFRLVTEDGAAIDLLQVKGRE